MSKWAASFSEFKTPCDALVGAHERILHQLFLEKALYREVYSYIQDQINSNVIYLDRVKLQLSGLLEQIDKHLTFLRGNQEKILSAMVPPASLALLSWNSLSTTSAVFAASGVTALGVTGFYSMLQFATAGIAVGLVGVGLKVYRQRRLEECWKRDTAVVKMFSDMLLQNEFCLLEIFPKYGIRYPVLSEPPSMTTDSDLSVSIESIRRAFSQGHSVTKTETESTLSTRAARQINRDGTASQSFQASIPFPAFSPIPLPSASPSISSYQPEIAYVNFSRTISRHIEFFENLRTDVQQLQGRRVLNDPNLSNQRPVPSITLAEFTGMWSPIAVSASGGSAGFVQKGVLYGRTVAYKALIHPEDRYYQRGVEHEVRALARLRGDSGVSKLVCTVVDNEAPNKLHGLVLEWIEGVTLREYLKMHPDTSTMQRLEMALEVADVLSRLHQTSLSDFSSTDTLSLPSSVSTSVTNSPASSNSSSPSSRSSSVSPFPCCASLPIVSASASFGGSMSLRKPIIHRDFKPNNVMVQSVVPQTSQATPRDWKLVLIDFGFSREMEESKIRREHGKAAIESDYPYVGTLAYLAPEIIDQSPWVTPAVDVYAFGISLPEILTGSVWLLSEKEKRSPAATVAQHFPALTPQSLVEPLCRLVLQCIEVQPERRISMLEVVQRLYDILKANWSDNKTLYLPSSPNPSPAVQSGGLERVKLDTITDSQLLRVPELSVECQQDVATLGRADDEDFPYNVRVALHDPSADFRVLLSDVTVHQNTLDIKFQPSESPFNNKYRHQLEKVLKGTRAEIVVQVFVLNGSNEPIGRCRVGLVVEWILDQCQVLRFFTPCSDDEDDDDDERKCHKINELGKSRFWVTLPLDWNKIVKDTQIK